MSDYGNTQSTDRPETVQTLGSAPILERASGTIEVTVSVPMEAPPSTIPGGGPMVNNLYFWVTWAMKSSGTAAFKGWDPTDLAQKDSQAPASFPGNSEKTDSYQEVNHIPTPTEPYFGIVTRVYPNQGNNKAPVQPVAMDLYKLDSNAASGFVPVTWPR